MLKANVLRYPKALIGLLFCLLSFNAAHLTPLSSSVMPMPGIARSHEQQSAQCQSSCPLAVPASKQHENDPERDNDKDPVSQALVLAPPVLSLLAVAFTVKLLLLLSSWRPPDYVRLYAVYLS